MKKVLSFLLLAVIVQSPLWAQQTADRPITLSNIWVTYEYAPYYPSEFRWMKDDQFYSVLENGSGIARYAIETDQKVEQILDFGSLNLGDISASDISSYEFSNDEETILLKANVTSIFRRSRKQQVMIAKKGDKNPLVIHEGAFIRNPLFSPDATKLAFVGEDNNIYYTDLASGQETQVTFDGMLNAVINGHTDWVYEEEFSLVQGMIWSPGGNRLAFMRFDEADVKQWNMPVYGSLYPNQAQFKYPKAGEVNADVSVHVFDLRDQHTTMADLGPEKDQYIPRMSWTQDAGEFVVIRMNRLQNQLDVLAINARTGASRTVLSEQSETYVHEPTDDQWYFLPENQGFLWLSEQDGYRHIYHYGWDGALIDSLTHGDWEVDKMVGVDLENELVYYTSTEVSPLERHLYRVAFNGKKKKQLTKTPGTHSITASSKCTYFVDKFSSINEIPRTVMLDSKGKEIRILESNQRLQRNYERHALRTPEFFNFSYTPSYRGQPEESPVTLNGWMIKPTDFDETQQYPVLMFVYGGPGSQEVLNAWGSGSGSFNYMWFQMLAQQGYIVACVDNRGTGGRGKAFRSVTYADLGKYETIDQVAAARYLGDLSYVDKDRIGIWGWSYGGYMTSLCMTKGNGFFKMGIAVAPVTNWRFYDTIYTERYLKRPQDNPRGYDFNSPINFANQLEGKYLLIHGTGDDNVHFQNTVEWVDALVAANKQFDLFFYPNRTHSIAGGNTRYHLYQLMTDYILENL